MDWDHLAEEWSQKLFASWITLLKPTVSLKLAGQHRPGYRVIKASSFTTGAFNICCIVTFEDEFRVVVRFKFPILGRSRFRTEKTWDEVSLRDTSVDLGDLEKAYRGMADVMLKLSKPIFSSIGALECELGIWQVTKRPMILTAQYFEELATQQLLHLQYQHNDVVKDEDDARKKYIARCLFRKIARDMQMEPGPFHLWCDDFCPSNVLVSESDLTISGVIDWKFTYAAPIEFTCTTSWWLLLERPEAWESDLNDFLIRYTPRLQIFLKIIRDCEDRQVRNENLTDSQRLSDRMAHSLDSGLF
ncbi:hypothetical protein ACJ72_03992 [Emergomyces africanus]|uniref:Aminoglycoside phosphotransferase domain-containing protein n=1 Tax=Emergomyces africanus TaxID=1955775 RepID=A0A1B7NY22_9EURO|nr:hypothetical protein ACJ72_03992 [Emergomyces africanus]